MLAFYFDVSTSPSVTPRNFQASPSVTSRSFQASQHKFQKIATLAFGGLTKQMSKLIFKLFIIVSGMHRKFPYFRLPSDKGMIKLWNNHV